MLLLDYEIKLYHHEGISYCHELNSTRVEILKLFFEQCLQTRATGFSKVFLGFIISSSRIRTQDGWI